MTYDKKIGRLRIMINENGQRDHGYAHGAEIGCPTGWNNDCSNLNVVVSVNELRDLQYLISDALRRIDTTKDNK